MSGPGVPSREAEPHRGHPGPGALSSRARGEREERVHGARPPTSSDSRCVSGAELDSRRESFTQTDILGGGQESCVASMKNGITCNLNNMLKKHIKVSFKVPSVFLALSSTVIYVFHC